MAGTAVELVVAARAIINALWNKRRVKPFCIDFAGSVVLMVATSHSRKYSGYYLNLPIEIRYDRGKNGVEKQKL